MFVKQFLCLRLVKTRLRHMLHKSQPARLLLTFNVTNDLHEGLTFAVKSLSQQSNCQRTLFIQLIHSVVFHVARHQPIA